MGAPSTAEVMQAVSKLSHRVAVLESQVLTLGDAFARYWIDDRAPAPAFAVVLSRYMKDGVPVADLFVISDQLSRADLKFGKKMIMSSDEPKSGKWEPVVLPKEVVSIMVQNKAAEAATAEPDDGNGALSP